MPTAWPTATHTASSMSDAIAPEIAHGLGGRGVVHSVFRSALNISWPNGLLTIAPESTGRLPNGIAAELGADLRSTVREGMAVRADADNLRIDGAGLAIDLRGAARWSPRLAAPYGGSRVAAERWRSRSRRTRAIAAAIAERRECVASGGGLRPLLLPTREEAGLGTAGHAGAILGQLERAIGDGERADATAAARTLIGLGPGLTPSGDDALVGIEAASTALEAPMAGFLDDALDHVDERTTAIAATLLRHAAAGEFAERLHWLLEALIGPDDATIPAALERAVAWGATSGTDCLVGVLLGLDAASRSDRSVN